MDRRTDISHADFEALFVANADLARIQSHLNRFNPLDVLKLTDHEIRHSNVLGWLLDPRETHGLGDRFLKAFLVAALAGEYAKPDSLHAMDIYQADLRDTEVLREWRHIDIFLLSRSAQLAFVIENKVHASQGVDQLAGYIRTVQKTFVREAQGLRIKGIFLTLHDEAPDDGSYATLTYGTVVKLLRQVMAAASATLTLQVKHFIYHYIETLEELTGMSETEQEMIQLAKSLYRQNRKLFDFIVQHGASTEFSLALDDLFGADGLEEGHHSIGAQPIVTLWSGKSELQFLPQAWWQALGGRAANWALSQKWGGGFPVKCMIELTPDSGSHGVTSGTLTLNAEIGPLADPQQRAALVRAIADAAAAQRLSDIALHSGAHEAGKKFSRFINTRVSKQRVHDVQSVDDIREAIITLVTKYAPLFEALTPALTAFGAEQRASGQT